MKLNLSNITSGYGAVAALNANFDAIETAVENTLSRDGTTPNEMLANLDMNGNDILNANAVDVSSLTINGTPVQPSTGVTVAQAFQSYTFTATLGQTSFSVSPYTPYVASVQVEVNGLSLPPADISVSGTNVVIPACSAGDEVVIRRYTDAPSPFPVADDITFTPAGTINTRSVQSKLRDVVSVKDFGAVGDGVADDTVAIQNAANYARTIGGTLVFPPGYTFGIQGLIYIRNGVRGVLGLGGKIKFLSGPLMSGVCLVGREGGESSNVSGCRVDGLYFECGSFWGVPIYGQNINNCTITNNVILDVGIGHGILIRSFVNGLADSFNNIIAHNTITGDTGSNPPHQSIVIDSPINIAPYSGADTYWKATFTTADATYKGINNVVIGNRVIGGYYGISLSAARFNTVVGNMLSFNVRNISVQNNCISNNISNNVLQDSISSAVHLAYGSSFNTISGNQIYSTRAYGQGMLQAYVGSTANKFVGNQVVAAGLATPNWHIYCGVHSSLNEFTNNTLRGAAAKAYIAVESAWDNTVTNPASYGYGETAVVNGFANAGMSQVSLKENTIFPASAVPAIFMAQISDGAGNYTLDQCVVQGNTVIDNTPSKQFELLEENSGNLNSIVLKGNSFATSSTASKFTLPRGRAHFSDSSGNTIVNTATIALTPGDTTPSVGLGAFFEHQDASPTNVTYYDDGTDNQEITVRLTVNTTIVHNNSFIRLKGNVNATGDSNKFIAFRRLSGIWFEIWRNF